MASFYADEDFPLRAVVALRRLGHDVLTTAEAGNANKAMPDDEVLQQAGKRHRALLTLNRWHFISLHRRSAEHDGIVACTADADCEALAHRVDEATRGLPSLLGILLRVNRASR
jgi:hypothetical protein